MLGIKPAWTAKPAYYVPEYAQRVGYEIIPVPVYYPEVTEHPRASRSIGDSSTSPDPIDIVDCFAGASTSRHTWTDMIAAHPRAVWMQLGIRNDAAAKALTAAGIDVVMDRCLLVEIEAHRARLAAD